MSTEVSDSSLCANYRNGGGNWLVQIANKGIPAIAVWTMHELNKK